MSDDRRVGYCPHCGNLSTHRMVSSFEAHGKEVCQDGFQELTGEVCGYYLAECETCGLGLLYFLGEDGKGPWDAEASEYMNARRIWPVTHELTDAVPEAVRRCYQEAARIRQNAPTAFAVQIRRALEALCNDKSTVKGPLQKRLQDLAFKNLIPPVLAEMSDLLRVLGNIGAHDDEQQITLYDAKVIDEFFKSIIEYVYEAPLRVQHYRAKLLEFGKQPPVEDDDHSSPASENPKQSVN